MPDLSAQADLGSNWHQGVGQGGNKSFCSYRMGMGIPGYTGFVPVHENISVPHKGPRAPTRHTGARGDGGALMPTQTTHKNDFSLTPAEFGAATAPNALWDIHADRPVGDPPFIRRPESTADQAVFRGTATYSEIDRGLEKPDFPENVTNLGQMRPQSVAGKKPTDNPLYITESAEKARQVAAEAAATEAAAAATKAKAEAAVAARAADAAGKQQAEALPAQADAAGAAARMQWAAGGRTRRRRAGARTGWPRRCVCRRAPSDSHCTRACTGGTSPGAL